MLQPRSHANKTPILIDCSHPKLQVKAMVEKTMLQPHSHPNKTPILIDCSHPKLPVKAMVEKTMLQPRSHANITTTSKTTHINDISLLSLRCIRWCDIGPDESHWWRNG